MSGAHYDNPLRISYTLGTDAAGHDFGAGSLATSIRVPAGVTRGRIEEVQISATETFNAVTTEGRIDMGTAADPNRYCDFGCASTAAASSRGLADETAALSGAAVGTTYGGNGVIDFSSSGENISQIEVDLVAPTGGTPAGKANVCITIAWW